MTGCLSKRLKTWVCALGVFFASVIALQVSWRLGHLEIHSCGWHACCVVRIGLGYARLVQEKNLDLPQGTYLFEHHEKQNECAVAVGELKCWVFACKRLCGHVKISATNVFPASLIAGCFGLNVNLPGRFEFVHTVQLLRTTARGTLSVCCLNIASGDLLWCRDSS